LHISTIIPAQNSSYWTKQGAAKKNPNPGSSSGIKKRKKGDGEVIASFILDFKLRFGVWLGMRRMKKEKKGRRDKEKG
jgi:hypothetical protein